MPETASQLWDNAKPVTTPTIVPGKTPPVSTVASQLWDNSTPVKAVDVPKKKFDINANKVFFEAAAPKADKVVADIDADSDLRDDEKDWLKQHRNILPIDQLKTARDVMAGRTSTQSDFMGNAKRYYFDVNGIPQPLSAGQVAPNNAKTQSLWGSQQQAEDDNALTTLAKETWNAFSNIVRMPAAITDFLWGEATGDKVHTAFFNASKNLADEISFNVSSEAGKDIVDSKAFTSLSEFFNSSNWHPSTQNIMGLAGQAFGSVLQFIASGKAMGIKGPMAAAEATELAGGNALTKAGILAKSYAPSVGLSTATMLSGAIDEADRAGLTGRDKYSLAMMNALGQGILEMAIGGQEGKLLGGFSKAGLTKEISAAGIAAFKDAGGEITPQALQAAFKATLKTGASKIPQMLKEVGKDAVGEGNEEALQQLWTNSLYTLHDKMSGKDQFHTSIADPNALKDYFTNWLGGTLGGIGGGGIATSMGNLEAQSKGIYESLTNGKEAELRNALTNLHENKELTDDQMEAANFRIDSYKRYMKEVDAVGVPLNDGQKEKIFFASWKHENVQNNIKDVEDNTDLSEPIKNGRLKDLNAQKKLYETEIADVLADAQGRISTDASKEKKATVEPLVKKAEAVATAEPIVEPTQETAATEKKPDIKFTSGKQENTSIADLTIARHGKTKQDELGHNSGWSDESLATSGKKEASRLGDSFKKQGVKTIVTSPIHRALQTAEIASKKSGAVVHPMEVLKTWNIGELEGKPEDDFDEKYYVENPDEVVPGGESFNSFKDRMVQAKDQLAQMKDQLENPKDLAVIAHSRNIRMWDALEKNNGWNDQAQQQYLSEADANNGKIDVGTKASPEMVKKGKRLGFEEEQMHKMSPKERDVVRKATSKDDVKELSKKYSKQEKQEEKKPVKDKVQERKETIEKFVKKNSKYTHQKTDVQTLAGRDSVKGDDKNARYKLKAGDTLTVKRTLPEKGKKLFYEGQSRSEGYDYGLEAVHGKQHVGAIKYNSPDAKKINQLLDEGHEVKLLVTHNSVSFDGKNNWGTTEYQIISKAPVSKTATPKKEAEVKSETAPPEQKVQPESISEKSEEIWQDRVINKLDNLKKSIWKSGLHSSPLPGIEGVVSASLDIVKGIVIVEKNLEKAIKAGLDFIFKKAPEWWNSLNDKQKTNFENQYRKAIVDNIGSVMKDIATKKFSKEEIEKIAKAIGVTAEDLQDAAEYVEEELRAQSYDQDQTEVNRQKVRDMYIDVKRTDGSDILEREAHNKLYSFARNGGINEADIDGTLKSFSETVDKDLGDHLLSSKFSQERKIALLNYFKSIRMNKYIYFTNREKTSGFKPLFSNVLHQDRDILNDITQRFSETMAKASPEEFTKSIREYEDRRKNLQSDIKRVLFTKINVQSIASMKGSITVADFEKRYYIQNNIASTSEGEVRDSALKQMEEMEPVRKQINERYKLDEKIQKYIQNDLDYVSQQTGIGADQWKAFMNTGRKNSAGVMMPSIEEYIRSIASVFPDFQTNVRKFLLGPPIKDGKLETFKDTIAKGEGRSQLSTLARALTAQRPGTTLMDRFDDVTNKKRNSFIQVSQILLDAEKIHTPEIQAKFPENEFVQQFADKQLDIIRAEGIKNDRTNKAVSNDDFTDRDMQVMLLNSFNDSSSVAEKNQYLMPIEQFSDKKQQAFVPAKKYSLEEAREKFKELQKKKDFISADQAAKIIDHWDDIISDLYSGVPSLSDEEQFVPISIPTGMLVSDFAKTFALNWMINKYHIDEYFQGKNNFSNYPKQVKRAGPQLSNGQQGNTEIEGGIGKTIRHIAINDPKIKVALSKQVEFNGVDGPDGISYISPAFQAKLEKSYGSLMDREKSGHNGIVKAIYSKVNDDGSRTLVKTMYVVVTPSFVEQNPKMEAIAKMMEQNNADIVSFESATKLNPKAFKNTVTYKQQDGADTMEIDTVPDEMKVQELDSNYFLVNQDLRHETEFKSGRMPRQLLRYTMQFGNSPKIQNLINKAVDLVYNELNEELSGMDDEGKRAFFLSNIPESDDYFVIRSLLQDGNITLDHPIISNFIPKIFASIVRKKVLDVKGNKAILAEVPAFGVDLKPISQNGKRIIPAEALLPADFKKQGMVAGDFGFIIRIPTSQLHSISLIQAKDFVDPEMGNVIIAEPGTMKPAGSDSDGDTRHMWVPFRDKKGDIISYDDNNPSYKGMMNEAFKLLVAEYTGDAIPEQKGREKLIEDRFEDLIRPIDTAAVDKNVAEYKHDNSLHRLDPSSFIEMFQSNNEGKDVIGIAARFLAVYSYAKTHNFELRVPIEVPVIINGKVASHAVLQSFTHDKKKQQKVDSNLANNLNQATDNANLQNLDPMGMTKGTATMFNALEALGLSERDTISFMNIPVVRDFISEFRKSESPTYSDKSKIFSNLAMKYFQEEPDEDLVQDIARVHWSLKPNEKNIKLTTADISCRTMEQKLRVLNFLDYFNSVCQDFFTLSNVIDLTENAPKSFGELYKAKETLSRIDSGDLKILVNSSESPLKESPYLNAARKNIDLATQYYHDHVMGRGRGASILGFIQKEYAKSFGGNWNDPKKMSKLSQEKIDTLDRAMQSYILQEAMEETKSPTELRKDAVKAFESLPETSVLKKYLEVDQKSGNIKMKALYQRYTFDPKEIEQCHEAFKNELTDNQSDSILRHHIAEYGYDISQKSGGFAILFDDTNNIEVSSRVSEVKKKWLSDPSGAEAIALELMRNNPILIPDGKFYSRNGKLYLADKLNGYMNPVSRAEDGEIVYNYPKYVKKIVKGKYHLYRLIKEAGKENTYYQEDSKFNVEKGFREKPVYTIVDTTKKDDINYQTEAYGQQLASSDPELFTYIQDRLAANFPHVESFKDADAFQEFISKNYFNGQFDLDALGAAFKNAVYINPEVAVQSTAVHEYAHIYWDMLPSDDAVKQEMETLFGSEEAAVQAIGDIGTEEANVSLRGTAYQKFLSALKGFWRKIKYALGIHNQKDLAAIMADEVWKYPREVESLQKDGPSVIKYMQDPNDKQRETVEMIQQISEHLNVNPDTKKTTMKLDGTELTGVTSAIGIDPKYSYEGKADQKAADNGTGLHSIAEALARAEDVADSIAKSGLNIHPDALESFTQQVKDFLTTLRADDSELIPEMRIASSTDKVVGIVDLTRIHPDGSVSIYDWKSMKSSSTSPKYTKTFREKASKKEKHGAQLSMYSRILEQPDDVFETNGLRIRDNFVIPIHYETNDEGQVIKATLEDLVDLPYYQYRDEANRIMQEVRDREVLHEIRDLDKAGILTYDQWQQQRGVSEDDLKAKINEAKVSNRRKEVGELNRAMKAIQREYAVYRHDFKRVQDIVKNGIEGKTYAELIDIKNTFASYDNLAYQHVINDLDYRIGNRVAEDQSGKAPEGPEQDIKRMDVRFMATTDITEQNPALQGTMKRFLRVEQRVTSTKAYIREQLQQLLKPVIEEKDGKGSTSKAKNFFSFYRNLTPYVEDLLIQDKDGKLWLKNEKAIKTKESLSPAKLALLDFLNKHIASVSHLQGHEVEGEQLNPYADGFFPMVRKKFWETYYNSGLLTAYSEKLHKDVKDEIFDVKLNYVDEHGAKIEMTYGDIVADIHSRRDTKKLSETVATAKLRRYFKMASKQVAKETGSSHSEKFTINQHGMLISKFQYAPSSKMMEQNLYSKDAIRSFLEYMDTMTEMDQRQGILPEVTAIKSYYEQMKGKDANVVKFVNLWMDTDILGKHVASGLGEQGDTFLHGLMTWTYMNVLALNPKAGLFNLVGGQLQTIRRYGFKVWGSGWKRMMSNRKKAKAMLNRNHVVSVHDAEAFDKTLPDGWKKVSDVFMSGGEKIIQSVEFLGNLTQEQWNSFDDTGNVIKDSAVDKMGKTEWRDHVTKMLSEKERVQGQYTKQFRAMYKADTALSAVMQFKGWMPAFLRERFGRHYTDMYGQEHKGSYRSFAAMLTDQKRQFILNREFWNSNDIDAQNMRKNFREMVLMGIAFGLYAMAHGDDKRDKNKGSLLLQIGGEMGMCFNMSSMEFLTSTPVPVLGTLNRFIKAFHGLGKTYLRDGKYGEKGDWVFPGRIMQVLPYNKTAREIYSNIVDPDYGQ